MVEKAVEIVSIFTKNDDAANGVADLHLMEASWFIVEQAESYYRLYLENRQLLSEVEASDVPENDEDQMERIRHIKDLTYEVNKYGGLALKRWNAVSKFYKQFEDDQLDFHSYCMRKGVPRAYLEMFNWGKRIFTLPMYVRAMKGAAMLYFKLHDDLQNSQTDLENNPADENTAAKKGSKKAKKEAAAMKKRTEEDKKILAAYENDDDVLGNKFISTKTPLQDFNEIFFQAYTKEAVDSSKDYVLEFEHQLRCGKLALCVGALSKYADAHGEDNSVVGAMVLSLLDRAKFSTEIDEITKKLALKGLERLFPSLPFDHLTDEASFRLAFILQREFQGAHARSITTALQIVRPYCGFGCNQATYPGKLGVPGTRNPELRPEISAQLRAHLSHTSRIEDIRYAWRKL